METCLSKWKVFGCLLISLYFFVLSSASAYAATTTYTLSINSAASVVHTTGGITGGGMGDLSVSGTFRAVVTDGVIAFQNIDVTIPEIVPSYPGTTTQTGTSLTFSGSKAYDNLTGGGTFNGTIGNATFSMSGNFNAPCCDQYNYQFVLKGTATNPCVDAATRCNDNNPCTTDTCDPATGQCFHRPVQCITGNTCDPETCSCVGCIEVCYTCTSDLQCIGGRCEAGTCLYTSSFCKGDACTTASCGPSGCVYTPINCNDNNPCTTDTCDTATGNCHHTPVQCPLGMTCDPQTCSCVGCLGPCRICTSDLQCSGRPCDPLTGTCVDTLSLCKGDACTNASCDPASGCVLTPKNCDDNNICTSDTCDPTTGKCVHTPVPDFGPVGLPCDDGNFCTTGDVCSNGVCAGIARNCADNLVCTTDTCDETNDVCVHTVSTGCLIGGVCIAEGATNPANQCQACLGATSRTAYSNKPTGTACNDGNACTFNDTCTNGVCKGSMVYCVVGPTQCQDGGPCGNGVGSPCHFVNKPNGTACNDGNACTIGDSCQNGVCMAGTPVVCPLMPISVCQTQICDPALGCLIIPVPNGTNCDDGQYCDGTDTCSNGTCVHSGNPCPNGTTCNESTDHCDTVDCTGRPVGTACNDNNPCTTNDVCVKQGKKMVCAGTPKNCDDGDKCTKDSCNPKTGTCMHTRDTSVRGCR